MREKKREQKVKETQSTGSNFYDLSNLDRNEKKWVIKKISIALFDSIWLLNYWPVWKLKKGGGVE